MGKNLRLNELVWILVQIQYSESSTHWFPFQKNMDQQLISKQLGPFRRKLLPQQGIFDAFAAHHFPVGQAPLKNLGPHPRTLGQSTGWILWELTDDHPPLGHLWNWFNV